MTKRPNPVGRATQSVVVADVEERTHKWAADRVEIISPLLRIGAETIADVFAQNSYTQARGQRERLPNAIDRTLLDLLMILHRWIGHFSIDEQDRISATIG